MSGEEAPSSSSPISSAILPSSPAVSASLRNVELTKGLNGLDKIVLREPRGSSAEKPEQDQAGEPCGWRLTQDTILLAWRSASEVTLNEMTGKIIGGTILAFLVALLLSYFLKSQYSPSFSFSEQRLFTAEELALYNGTDERLPILLGILGSIFDVTKGKSHYGMGGGYNHFAGRDASRAFVSGNFTGDGLTDSLRGLSSSQVNSIVGWRDFYFRNYTFVGKLVGLYYDNHGNPTKHLKGAEVKAARGAQLLEKQKQEEAKQPSCNSRWSQDEGGKVWCDDGFPRLVQRPLEIALTGQMSKRCACFREDQLGDEGLEVYEGCDHLSNTCKV